MAVYIDTELCKGCGLCVSGCPKGVFEITRRVNGKGYNYVEAVHEDRCVKCAVCQRSCPDFAIDVE
jgi:2-oxoglutarate ferredoxin oxidoreductase subunit delta